MEEEVTRRGEQRANIADDKATMVDLFASLIGVPSDKGTESEHSRKVSR